MSDKKVVFEEPEVEEKKTKAKKPRKPMSEERKEALRLQLAKAREKSNEVRKKKALAKKIDKEEQEKALDEKIAQKVLKKSAVDDEISALKDEIKQLRESGGSNAEIKALREELNLFKKGLAEQIEKAKEIEAKRMQKPKEQNIKIKVETLDDGTQLKYPDNNIEQDVKEEPKQVVAPPPKPQEKKFKTMYDKRRGLIKIPIN